MDRAAAHPLSGVRDEGVLTRALAEGDAAYLEGSLHEDVAAAGSQFDAMAGPWAD